nr:HNH endonuclease [uncultured Aminipila sp.]
MFAVAPTDLEWFNYLKENVLTKEVNFWTPTPWNVKKIERGDKLYFMLKSPIRKIGGYGFFEKYENTTARDAWNKYGLGNGVSSLAELESRCSKYVTKNSILRPRENLEIGCIILRDLILYDEQDYFDISEKGYDFPSQVVKLKYFSEGGITENVTTGNVEPFFLVDKLRIKTKNKKSNLKDRIGQSKFRKELLEAYGGKCCVTGSTTFDVIEAAHIQEYVNEESNHIQNGLPLRTDIHRLFDSGLITVNEQYKICVSPYLSEPYYKAFNNKKISLPKSEKNFPSLEALKYHNSVVYRTSFKI